jgi:hypothetical protein
MTFEVIKLAHANPMTEVENSDVARVTLAEVLTDLADETLKRHRQ